MSTPQEFTIFLETETTHLQEICVKISEFRDAERAREAMPVEQFHIIVVALAKLRSLASHIWNATTELEHHTLPDKLDKSRKKLISQVKTEPAVKSEPAKAASAQPNFSAFSSITEAQRAEIVRLLNKK